MNFKKCVKINLSVDYPWFIAYIAHYTPHIAHHTPHTHHTPRSQTPNTTHHKPHTKHHTPHTTLQILRSTLCQLSFTHVYIYIYTMSGPWGVPRASKTHNQEYTIGTWKTEGTEGNKSMFEQ